MLDPDIQTLVGMGDIIGAIGLYQQRHGGSTLVARKAIDAARRELDRAAEPEASVPVPDSAPRTVINDRELDAALRAGEKIAAIKRYRELYGVGLKEAKDAVEAMQAGQVVVHPPQIADDPPPQLQPELDRLIAQGLKIPAIKHYREVTHLGLKESKDAVEARIDELAAAARAAEQARHAASMAAPPDMDTTPGLQPELDRLIRADLKVNAIKHYRDVTGRGLKESKDAVEARMADMAALSGTASPALAPDLQPELDRLIRAGQKINAIKHYRTLTNVGLKEAKDAVEARMQELGVD